MKPLRDRDCGNWDSIACSPCSSSRNTWEESAGVISLNAGAKGGTGTCPLLQVEGGSRGEVLAQSLVAPKWQRQQAEPCHPDFTEKIRSALPWVLPSPSHLQDQQAFADKLGKPLTNAFSCHQPVPTSSPFHGMTPPRLKAEIWCPLHLCSCLRPSRPAALTACVHSSPAALPCLPEVSPLAKNRK